MPVNPFEREIAAAQDAIARQVSQDLTAALRAPRLLTQVAEATNSSERRPPRNVIQLYENALRSPLQRARRQYSYATVTTELRYEMGRARRQEHWLATVTASAEIPTTTRGGGSYAMCHGDTLWGIAEQFYGNGAYWVAIAEANPRTTNRSHRNLICGAQLRIPNVVVVTNPNRIRELRQCMPTTAPAPARRTAQPMTFEWPTITVGMDKTQDVNIRECVGNVRLNVRFSLTGSVNAQRDGEISPVTFDPRSYKTAIERVVGNITTSFSITDFTTGQLSISNSVLGGRWSTSVSLDTDGRFTFRVAPRSISRNRDGITVSGDIGFEVSVRIEGACDQQAGSPAPAPARGRGRQGSDSTARDVAAVAAGATAGAGVLEAIRRALQSLCGGRLVFRLNATSLMMMFPSSWVDPNRMIDSHGRITSGSGPTA